MVNVGKYTIHGSFWKKYHLEICLEEENTKLNINLTAYQLLGNDLWGYTTATK